jgi:hypothetical protein
MYVPCACQPYHHPAQTFGQLREERESIIDDVNTHCFICSMESHLFEQHGGFRQHYTKEHNLWFACIRPFMETGMHRMDTTILAKIQNIVCLVHAN